jgi:integrase
LAGTPFRFSLDRELHRRIESKSEAVKEANALRAAIDAGTFRQPAPPSVGASAPADRPTFAMVADQYAHDVEGLAKLSESSQERHRYDVAFLKTVIVPPGMPFTDKPFGDIIRADIKLVLAAKETPTAKTYIGKRGKTWMRTIGGKVAVNRLHDRLRSLWSWAIEEQYAATSPFIRTRQGKNRLKHDEHGRSRRLRDGEETALLEHAGQHLRDCIVAALETGMRKGELLSLQWKQVRFLQNDLYLPGAKTKTRRDRKIPISPGLREILIRRQYGMTEGPNPQRFKFGPDHYVFGNEIGDRVQDIKTAGKHRPESARREARSNRHSGARVRVSGQTRRDRPALSRPAARSRVTEDRSWLAAPRSQRIPGPCEHHDDGAIPQRQGRLPAGTH